ncbi:MULTISPECIES: dienelactone hydrolase family protein [Streptomyces]|uniref:Phosphoribosyl transferase n=4 Tax=Streptomyces TaxID=1883 RepID=A0A291T1X6_STRMQ|nr:MULTISPECIES: dienelactone hydrolase family protein [Streptomyces]AQA15379.1 hydrolase [Streptomyces autolyticus]ATL87136.1 dienelactone hydrolase-like enzyme [Streptomyces malaysiensis]MCC4314690.1 dienelactone hydrolase family protein [Streptomyces malaysiensis]MCD9594594.1 dienelactone hydrolase family protein [Streptomyces sp. 8ZJF_21]MCM3811774.1 dienelactone hydrolase family protein [Streptomyces sp. DR7-3]
MRSETARIAADDAMLVGDLALPDQPLGVVAFAHGSGSSRHSPRNRAVARVLQDADLATLLFDLLTEAEERVDAITAELRFDIPLLGRRLVAAVNWLDGHPATSGLPVGLFGASTGAAAALTAAAERPERVAAVVSRGGRPDLAGGALNRVRAPVLLIVGGDDHEVLRLNQQAAAMLAAPQEIHVVPGASHLFEEPGTLEQAAEAARDWFVRMGKRPARGGKR